MFQTIFYLVLIVSLSRRSTGKRFDVATGANGCLASGFCIFGFVVAFSALFFLVLPKWLDPTPVIAQSKLGPLMYFVSLSLVGGYIAARLGRTTGWTNSLVVGLFVVSWQLAMLLDKLIKPDWQESTFYPLLAIFEKPLAYWGRLPGRLFDHLIEMLQEPNWGQLPTLVLTIPAAVLGGFLWQWSHPTPPQLPSNTVPHKPLTLMNKILGLRFPILCLAFLCLLVLAIIFFDEPAVVKAIKDRGGIVKGDPVVSVAFPSSVSVSDDDLKMLKELTSLKMLNLDSANITDEGLQELKEIVSLESLTLSNSAVTGAGLRQFMDARPKIRVYSRAGNRVY